MNRTAVFLTAVLGAAAGAQEGDRPSQTPVFAGRTELTVLNVVVTNRAGGFVAGVPREAFTVYDEGHQQTVALFSAVDAPATIALLVDGSASMLATRELVSAAVRTFASTSNPQDEIVPLTFTERVHAVLPDGQVFTSDPGLLEASLRTAVRAHGRTALHDAVAEALTYLDRGRHLRRVLVVISDGADNASRATFDQVAHAAAAANTVIYTIAILDPLSHDGRPDRLKTLAAVTGGTVQTPHTPAAVRQALEQVARDIRSGYLLGYVPPAAGPTVRRVNVTVRAGDGPRLRARTRREYIRPPE